MHIRLGRQDNCCIPIRSSTFLACIHQQVRYPHPPRPLVHRKHPDFDLIGPAHRSERRARQRDSDGPDHVSLQRCDENDCLFDSRMCIKQQLRVTLVRPSTRSIHALSQDSDLVGFAQLR